MGKWDAKIWHQTSQQGSNCHRKRITKLTFRALALRHSLYVSLPRRRRVTVSFETKPVNRLIKIRSDLPSATKRQRRSRETIFAIHLFSVSWAAHVTAKVSRKISYFYVIEKHFSLPCFARAFLARTNPTFFSRGEGVSLARNYRAPSTWSTFAQWLHTLA